MVRERIAAAAVVAAVVGLVVGVVSIAPATSSWRGRPGLEVFNLTGVASEGVWTLDDVNGLNYWWRRFEPATLHVRRGDRVVIKLRSADVFHRFYLPGFGVGPVDVEPGYTVEVEFTASTEGVFQYYCTSMCGRCHFYMRGWVVVTAPGETPVEPPDIACPLCLPDVGPPPDTDRLVELGAHLYLAKGCITCHGAEGRGGVANENSTKETVPEHRSTAHKLFLASREDADSFIELLQGEPDLAAVEEPPEISLYPVVVARYGDAEEIIRTGRYSGKLDPDGPEPPLQMPAWKMLVEEREIDALLAYFISLDPWDEG